jgi:hypothetical protein
MTVIEKQHVKIWWAWLILIAIWMFFFFLIIQQVVLSEAEKDPEADIWILIGLLIVPTALIIFFLKLNLSIHSNEEGVTIHLSPFMASVHIPWKEVQSIEYVNLKYSGYGYRLSSKLGTIYRLEGDEGVQISTKSGGKICFSTRSNAVELAKNLTRIKNAKA